KGAETAKGINLHRLASPGMTSGLKFSLSQLRAFAEPLITTWPGELKLAGETGEKPLSFVVHSQRSRTCSSSRPKTAVMEPSPTGTADCMAWPRCRTARMASEKLRLSLATRAAYSPMEWPAAAAGSKRYSE